MPGHVVKPWFLLGSCAFFRQYAAAIFLGFFAAAMLAHVGPSWSPLGAILAPCWPILAPCWPHVGPSWPHVGPSWPHVGLPGRHLGPSWPMLAPCWRILVPCWPVLGAILAPCWPILGLGTFIKNVVFAWQWCIFQTQRLGFGRLARRWINGLP